MSQDDQIRWDRQHSESVSREEPARFLAEVIESESWEIMPGRVLDVACGKGRNAIYLARRGFHVTAVDISPVALELGRKRAEELSLSIDWRQADMDELQLGRAEFDLIININYLQRSLIRQFQSALRSGGHVIFDTYLIDQQTIGHPKNPAYLLDHNELLRQFSGFRVLYYREGKFLDQRGWSFRAALLACKEAQ